jgi:hypothetical protein
MFKTEENEAMKWTSRAKAVLIAMIIVSFSACAAVVVGGAAGATYSYVRGWLAMDYNVSLNRAYNASIKALEHHGLRILEQEKDITIAFVKAKGAKREIWIRLKRRRKRITRVSIRVGVMGDRKASRMIHDTIGDFL